jgi:5-methyltetrahydrofolate--homocysteine methyltransferase
LISHQKKNPPLTLNEVSDMLTLLQHYNQHIQAPLMIDSTESNVIERALQTVAGKPIVNSINFEDGEVRTRKVLELCQKYGAAVVALTIDELGMAKTCEKKVEIADRILTFTREYGLPDHDVFLDCLTFTLASQTRSRMEDCKRTGSHTRCRFWQRKDLCLA